MTALTLDREGSGVKAGRTAGQRGNNRTAFHRGVWFQQRMRGWRRRMGCIATSATGRKPGEGVDKGLKITRTTLSCATNNGSPYWFAATRLWLELVLNS